MAKQGAKTATPRLRFPEFRKADAWAEKPLKEICTVNPQNDGLPDSFIYIDLESVEGGVLKSRNRIKKKSAPSRAQRLLSNGDVIFQVVRPYQRNNLFVDFRDADAYVASTGYAQLRAKGSKPFLYQLIHTDTFVQKVIEKCTGSNYPAINSTDLAEVASFAPAGVKEQQKIADCLTSLDEVIAAQGRKVEALKAHKRGLMQQLFPREGETRPRLRFPEFRDEQEWVETTIGEVGEFYYGKSAPKWSLEKDAATSCVRYGELYTKFGVVINETVSRTNIDPRNLRFSKGGEILVPRVGEKPEDFGRCCCYLPLANVAIGEMISVFETDQNPLFYTYYFRKMYREFAKVVEGQNVKNLYYTELEPLAICRPSVEEQKAISDCLFSLDKQIASEFHQLAALKTHKQGLMQQLFPSPEAAGA